MSVPPLVVCTAAAALYGLGGRGRVGSARGRRQREAMFYAGLLIVLAALEPPFDTLADTSFAMHMAQHVLLISFAPPLLVLGRPWPRMWMPFPSRARRATARGLARGTWSAPLRIVVGALRRPPVGVAAMSVALAVWHVPALYDAALTSEAVHVFEHLCFVGTALLFWGSMLEAPPIRARIDHLRRAIWFALAAVPGFILAIVLAYASTPLYSAYADVVHRPGGISALGDQAISAGVMWVPGSLTFFAAFFVSVYRWLEPGADEARPAPRPEELSWT